MSTCALSRLTQRLRPFLQLQRRLEQGSNSPVYSALFSLQVIRRHTALLLAHRLERLADRPMLVHSQGLAFYVNPTLYEVGPLLEVFRTRVYDRLPEYAAQQGEIVIDIGANIGAFTLLQAQRGATVYAYEPNPDCFTRLLRTVERNHFTAQVHPYQQAVGAAVGRGTLEVPPTITPSGTMRWEATGSVTVTTLAEICTTHNLTQIDLLKIDTEGSEVDILAGAGTALKRVRRLLLEYHSVAWKEACCRLLEAQGFVIQKHLCQETLPHVGVLYAQRAQ